MQMYKKQEDYPIPVDLKPNLSFARLLMNDYSGRTSELTAIHQYIYHHIFAEDNKNISSTLRGIAIVEMHHLDMLGDCILQLGLPPKFCYFRGRQTNYWNSSFINYGTSLRQMIENDILGEQIAIQSYYETIARIDEPQIQKLIYRIIEDEKLHIEILTSILESSDLC